MIDHSLPCPKGGLVLERHDENAYEWEALGARALVPSAITYKPKINSRTVKGERNDPGERQEVGTADDGADIVGEYQGGSGHTVNVADRLAGRPGQVEVPAELRADVSAHGFWKRGTTTMFYIRIANLDVGSYLRMTPENVLAKAEMEKKDLYLQACLERRQTFTPMFYSLDGMPVVDSLAAQKILVALLRYKQKREYSEICGLVRTRMSLVLVRSNSLLLRVPWGKGERIRHQPELTDGALMVLMLPWRG